MYATLASQAEEAAIHVCWRQWQTLVGEGSATGIGRERSIIDPEALVATSLWLRSREQRLTDRLRWWASKGSRLLSVQRMISVSELLPPDESRAALQWFATLAAQAGDTRWKRLAQDAKAEESSPRAMKGPQQLRLLEPATLMLALRAGFGVGAKADVMTFLMGSTIQRMEPRPTATLISRSLSYSSSSIRRALREMLLGRFIEASKSTPHAYTVDALSWSTALKLRHARAEPSTPPPWQFWSHTFGFLIACSHWGRTHGAAKASEVVMASRARDIVERFEQPLSWAGIRIPDADEYVGARYLETFETLLEQVAEAVVGA